MFLRIPLNDRRGDLCKIPPAERRAAEIRVESGDGQHDPLAAVILVRIVIDDQHGDRFGRDPLRQLSVEPFQ